MNTIYIPTEEELTAYALGEVDDKQKEAIEIAVSIQPDTKVLLDAIRETIEMSEGVFAGINAEALSEEQRETVVSAASNVVRLPRRRSWQRVVGYAAAACLVAGIVVLNASDIGERMGQTQQAKYELTDERKSLIRKYEITQTGEIPSDVDYERFESIPDEKLLMDINRLARETGIYRFTITDINNAGASAARSPKDQVSALSEELVVRAYNAKNKEKARADVGGEAAAGISGGRGELVGGAVAQNPQPVPRGQIADDRDVIVFFQNAAPEMRENAPVETEELFGFDQQGEQSPQSAGAYKRIGLEPMKGGNSSGSAGVQIQEGVVQQLGNYQTQVDTVTGKPLQTAQVPGLQKQVAFGATVTDLNGATPIREELESLGYLGDPQGQQGITAARTGGTALFAGQAQQLRSMQDSMGENPPRFAMRSPAPGVHTSERRPATAPVPQQRLESLGYISGDGVPIFGDVPATGGGFGAGGFRVAGVPPQDWGFIAPSPPTITPGTEDYERIVESRFKKVSQAPLSTFSIDVDTASYSNMRRFITQGSMPPVDSVRIEELINYFDYDYPQPVGEDPFSSTIEVSTAPWNPQHKLVRVGLKGKEIAVEERPSTNLVFLLDVSGSMKSQNKLPLVKQSIRLLTEQLTENDRVAMVVYAGNSGLVLPSTPGNRQQDILGALNRLSAGGSTNGGAGIQLAYDVAAQNFIEGGVNRVILASDGDFNVGTTSRTALVEMIEQKAKSGVFLTVLGYGMGNLKDATMEQLANKGNGNYAYIDTFHEAKKVLSDELNATLFTIAKDVKIQVEFNPNRVHAYRLIGYENRALANRDFNDDTKDAGEIGAGHTVTALYEIVPAGAAAASLSGNVDELRYQTVQQPEAETFSRPAVDGAVEGELLTVKLRYKQPDGNVSKLLEFHVNDTDAEFRSSSVDFKFATAVAAFGMKLRNSPFATAMSYDTVMSLAEGGRGYDLNGYRSEFIDLVRKAKSIAPRYVQTRRF